MTSRASLLLHSAQWPILIISAQRTSRARLGRLWWFILETTETHWQSAVLKNSLCGGKAQGGIASCRRGICPSRLNYVYLLSHRFSCRLNAHTELLTPTQDNRAAQLSFLDSNFTHVKQSPLPSKDIGGHFGSASVFCFPCTNSWFVLLIFSDNFSCLLFCLPNPSPWLVPYKPLDQLAHPLSICRFDLVF